MATQVCVETGTKKVFAVALDWPGWARSGKTEEAALDALRAYADRYAQVVQAAGLPFPASAKTLRVTERIRGGASTDFGIPHEPAAADSRRVTAADAQRLASLVTSAWATLDEVAAAAPPELRKGPRGGGRDRDKMLAHVLEAQAAYARKIGIKQSPPAIDDVAAIEEQREAIATLLATPSDGGPLIEGGWTARYAARRIAWHVLDHAWEMQDRAEP
jgi:hypothetical protein